MKRSFLALIIACSQLLGQDRDLPGYKLAFEDNFDTLSVGSDTDKGSATWGNWPPHGPAGAFSRSHWAQWRLEVVDGVLRSNMV